MIQELIVHTQLQSQMLEVTDSIQKLITKSEVKEGIALLFVPHTTAAITINENADPDVSTDIVSGLDKLIPLHNNYRHIEGNSAAHIKCSLLGVSEQIIIHNGQLQLGTWQGIYFCEFDGPRKRRLQIKLIADNLRSQ